jgi:hypothetical protein
MGLFLIDEEPQSSKAFFEGWGFVLFDCKSNADGFWIINPKERWVWIKSTGRYAF